MVAAAVCAVVVVGCVLVYRFDPEQVSWMPKCAVHMLTGYDCPSCGSTRAVHHMMHGDILDGLRYNWFVLYSWPFFLFIVLYEVLHPRGARPRWYWWSVYLYLVLYVVWGITRNLLGI